jgi:hypothetical protein
LLSVICESPVNLPDGRKRGRLNASHGPKVP